MNVILTKPAPADASDQAFASVRDRLPGTGRVPGARQRAFDSYARRGLPHRRIEDWKYTDLRVLMREVLAPARPPDQAAIDAAEKALKAHAIKGVRKLVLVDGAFVPQLSDLEDLQGLQIRTLREVLEGGEWASGDRLISVAAAGPNAAADRSDPMVALNASMMTDGVIIEVADGVALAQPLHIVHIATTDTPAALFTRSMFRVGIGATATLVESFIAARRASTYQVHDGLMMLVGDRARLDHRRRGGDNPDALHISS